MSHQSSPLSSLSLSLFPPLSRSPFYTKSFKSVINDSRPGNKSIMASERATFVFIKVRQNTGHVESGRFRLRGATSSNRGVLGSIAIDYNPD